MPATTQHKPDIHQEITDRIVKAIETAGDFRFPWIRDDGGTMKRPVNVASGNPYNGVNILSLWIATPLSAAEPVRVDQQHSQTTGVFVAIVEASIRTRRLTSLAAGDDQVKPPGRWL